jgi:hypothetical protein
LEQAARDTAGGGGHQAQGRKSGCAGLAAQGFQGKQVFSFTMRAVGFLREETFRWPDGSTKNFPHAISLNL